MTRATEDGRILTVVPEGEDRASISEEDTRLVYRQPRCRRCGAAVEARPIGGRTAYSCPRCQPE
jgi:formamidopyrimidine-DNA glycosylase